MTTLLEITEDLSALDTLLCELGGDVSDEQAGAAIDKWLAELGGALECKIDNYAALIRSKEARAEVRDAEAKRLANRVRIDRRGADFLKSRLKAVLEQRHLKKLETARFVVSVQGNGGVRPLDVHLPVEQLPEWARRTPPAPPVEANTEEIRRRLEAGETLDFAVLGDRGTRLAIR